MILRKKILIIDDDDAVIGFLAAKLGGDFDVMSTVSPHEAMRLVHEHKPNLILCDINMPELDGGDISAALFGDDSARAIPFVYLTALVTPSELRASGGHLGGRLAISKHLPPEEMLSRLRALLED